MQSTVIRRRKLYEEVVTRIEAMIHSGHYAPGDRLPSERELMKQFGVGRPAVREALFALQSMGLVAISNGEPARVTRPTPQVVVETLSGAARHLLAQPDGIRHFQDARTFFEIGLARHAALHATEDDLRQLAKALAANKAAIGDARAFEQTDVAFHYVLALIPRNPIYSAIHGAIAEWLTEQRTITLRYAGQNEVAYRAHEAIHAAIVARDPDRAERLIREHLDQVTNLYWTMMGSGHERIRNSGGISPEAGNIRAFPRPDRRQR